jgi:hypothetical protein
MNPLFIAPIFELLKSVLGGLGLDPEAKARAQAQAFDALTNGTFAERAGLQQAVAQLEVNRAEAAGGDKLGRWRSALGWGLTAALIGQFAVSPWLEWAAKCAGYDVPPFPKLDDMMWELLCGMLGLGTLDLAQRRLKGGK